MGVDASFAFRLILPGLRQAGFRSLVVQWLQDGYELVAPALWLYEITSALCKAVSFRKLTPEEGERALALARSLGVERHPIDWYLTLVFFTRNPPALPTPTSRTAY